MKWQNRSDVPLYSGLYNINICPMKNSEYKRFFIQFERKKSGNYPYSHLLPWQKESSGNFLLFIVCNFFPFYLFVILSGMINSWKGNLKSFSSPFTFVGPFLKVSRHHRFALLLPRYNNFRLKLIYRKYHLEITMRFLSGTGMRHDGKHEWEGNGWNATDHDYVPTYFLQISSGNVLLKVISVISLFFHDESRVTVG